MAVLPLAANAQDVHKKNDKMRGENGWISERLFIFVAELITT